MHRKRLSTILGATATAVLLTLTAACGSSDSGSGDSGSSSEGSSKSDGGDDSADLTSSDIFTKLTDAQKEAGSYKFTISFTGGTGTGEADLSSDPPNVSAKLGEGAQGIETRQVDGIYYMKASLFGTDKWIKIDPKDEEGLGAMLGSLGSSDPTATLNAIGDAAEVKKGGTEDIDGTEATQYDVSVPSKALADATKMPAESAKMLPKTITYTLFVDGDDLLRRMVTDFEVSGQAVKTQIDFTGYGDDVSVEAPPSGEIEENFKFPGMGGAAQ